ncbi:unnamed protein product [Staurois parvus]|uniref:Osteocalcin n=1 Tax=Staurois parvus TaxID=386267 RepID=A0ABN9AJW0_9NEOB|nr:unnamed protein product [Staurois parvus]
MEVRLIPAALKLLSLDKEAANFAKRHRRSNLHNAVFGAPVRDPLEPKREVCELNPSCDELADHVGIQEAYRRFYGPV